MTDDTPCPHVLLALQLAFLGRQFVVINADMSENALPVLAEGRYLEAANG